MERNPELIVKLMEKERKNAKMIRHESVLQWKQKFFKGELQSIPLLSHVHMNTSPLKMLFLLNFKHPTNMGKGLCWRRKKGLWIKHTAKLLIPKSIGWHFYQNVFYLFDGISFKSYFPYHSIFPAFVGSDKV